MEDDNFQNKSSEKNDIESLDLSQNEFEINVADINYLYRLSRGEEFDVYSALYKNKAVAVKRSHGSALVDDERERFTREVEILKRVNHSSIVKLIGATVVDGDLMIMVFQLVENSCDLQRYLMSPIPKPLKSFVVTTALLASEAMEYLHSQGIMHGNLFSKNLLLAENAVKLTGFSEAKEELNKILLKQDVFDFGALLMELIGSVNSSQKHKIPESLRKLMGDCLSMFPEDRPDFALITQNLKSIFSKVNLLEDLDLDFDDLMSESEIPSLCEEMPCNWSDVADSEVGLLSSIQHESRVQDMIETLGDTSPVLTEAMDGETLEEYLLGLKPNTPNNKTAIRLALWISEAMQQLHAQGISHRNLKSSNVFFLTKDREFLSLGDLEHREEKTDEMDHGKFKADVYNFSQILWELLTNNYTPFQTYASSTKEKRPVLEGVPDEMVELLMCCGSEKEEERPDFIHITATLTNLLNENMFGD